MEEERLDDPIEVIFFFGEKERRPIRFRWNNRVVKIVTAKGYWQRREGITICHYWAVTDSEGTYYELELNADHLEWRLRRLIHSF